MAFRRYDVQAESAQSSWARRRASVSSTGPTTGPASETAAAEIGAETPEGSPKAPKALLYEAKRRPSWRRSSTSSTSSQTNLIPITKDKPVENPAMQALKLQKKYAGVVTQEEMFALIDKFKYAAVSLWRDARADAGTTQRDRDRYPRTRTKDCSHQRGTDQRCGHVRSRKGDAQGRQRGCVGQSRTRRLGRSKYMLNRSQSTCSQDLIAQRQAQAAGYTRSAHQSRQSDCQGLKRKCQPYDKRRRERTVYQPHQWRE